MSLPSFNLIGQQTTELLMAGSLFSHFLGSLFSNFSKCWEIQVWLPRHQSFYIYKISLDLNNVSTKFQLDWPANNRIIARSLFSHFLRRVFVYQLFKMLENTGMVAERTKSLQLEDKF